MNCDRNRNIASMPELPSIEEHSLQGCWVSEGYGFGLRFHDGEVQVYEISPLRCIPSYRGRHEGRSSDESSANWSV